MPTVDAAPGDDTAIRTTSRLAPSSTPSTWAGGLVLISVLGLALMRRSFRRIL